MGTVLNAGKKARRDYKSATEKFEKAVREDVQGNISLYYEDRLEEAEFEIGKALGSNQCVQNLLDKKSVVKKDYDVMNNELTQMHNKIQKVL